MPQVIDSLAEPIVVVATSSWQRPGDDESEILAARRAFSTAQQLLSGAPIQQPRILNVGWHGSSVSSEDGSFAVVSAAYADLVGEVISVIFANRQVFAYVLQVADVPVDVSLTRRLFAALNRLTIVSLPATVVPVQ